MGAISDGLRAPDAAASAFGVPRDRGEDARSEDLGTTQRYLHRSRPRSTEPFGCWKRRPSIPLVAIRWQRDLPRSLTHLGRTG